MANVDKNRLLDFLYEKHQRYDRLADVLDAENKEKEAYAARSQSKELKDLHIEVLQGRFDERVWK